MGSRLSAGVRGADTVFLRGHRRLLDRIDSNNAICPATLDLLMFATVRGAVEASDISS
jgi:hypothetical protein